MGNSSLQLLQYILIIGTVIDSSKPGTSNVYRPPMKLMLKHDLLARDWQRSHNISITSIGFSQRGQSGGSPNITDANISSIDILQN